MSSIENPWKNCLEVAAVSDIGLRSRNNQDSHAEVPAKNQKVWNNRGHLFAVADGMGAHAAGELASKLAVDTIPLAYLKMTTVPPAEALRSAVEEANRVIFAKGSSDVEMKGMGTTSVTLVMLPEGVILSHVGDSRIYRLRGQKFEQLTFDHSVVWEREAAGLPPDENVPKNILSRSLGIQANVKVDLEGPYPCQVGDIFLLCSDGLAGQFEDSEIGKILSLPLPLAEVTQSLVDLANLRGGHDNITVTTIKYLGPQKAVGKMADALGIEPTPKTVLDCPPAPAWMWQALWGGIALALISLPFLFYMPILGAILFLIALGLGGGVGFVLKNRKPAVPFTNHRLGKGPYRSFSAVCDEALVHELTRMYRELKKSAREQNPDFDWAPVEVFESHASKAIQAKKLVEACKALVCAISAIWRKLAE